MKPSTASLAAGKRIAAEALSRSRRMTVTKTTCAVRLTLEADALVDEWVGCLGSHVFVVRPDCHMFQHHAANFLHNCDALVAEAYNEGLSHKEHHFARITPGRVAEARGRIFGTPLRDGGPEDLEAARAAMFECVDLVVALALRLGELVDRLEARLAELRARSGES